MTGSRSGRKLERRAFIRAVVSTLALGLGVRLGSQAAEASNCGIWCVPVACDHFSCNSPDINTFRCTNRCTGQTFHQCLGGCSSFCFSQAC